MDVEDLLASFLARQSELEPVVEELGMDLTQVSTHPNEEEITVTIRLILAKELVPEVPEECALILQSQHSLSYIYAYKWFAHHGVN